MDGLVFVVVLALAFAYVNGMHDAATTIATSVATRTLTPAIAVAMAAGFNLVGALLGDRVAQNVAEGIIDPGTGNTALAVLGSALVGATLWSLLTWRRGVPSSSSHALIGGLAGAGLVASVTVHWSGLVWLLVLPMVLVPLLALLSSLLLTVALMWLARNSSPSRSHRRFQQFQAISAAALALGHGLQDGQKALGAIMLALLATGQTGDNQVTWWMRLLVACALAAGTAAGGWRIVRTLGRRLCDLDAPRGFAAEAVAASLLYASAYGLGAPVSTTHTLTAAVVGAGVSRRVSAVRWRVAREIGFAWVLTPPGAGLLAAGCFLLLRVTGLAYP